MTDKFNEIADRQGWDAAKRQEVLRNFIDNVSPSVGLYEYAEKVAQEEGEGGDDYQEEIFLVAFNTSGKPRQEAELALSKLLTPLVGRIQDGALVECWWIAEDDRQDGSDNDSAVFVSPGMQRRAAKALNDALLGNTRPDQYPSGEGKW